VNSEAEEAYKTHLRDTMGLITKKSKRLNPQYEKTEEVFRFYKKYETIMKSSMKKRDDILTEDDFMDHHKIAAALCCSVLKARPINSILDNSGKDLDFIEKHPNEYCAYLLGLQAIQNFWHGRNNGNNNDEAERNHNSPIRPPKPHDDNNTYTDWFTKLIIEETFAHLDYETDQFEGTLVFLIAHIYFLIESYNEQYYKE